MKPVFIFIKAVGIYLLLTLPTIVLPPMYLISAFYAISFGWAACILFVICYQVLLKSHLKFKVKWNILFASVPVAVAVAHSIIGLSKVQGNVWELSPFLCFPAAAIVAGWISLYSFKKSVCQEFVPGAEDETTLTMQPINN